MRPLSTPTPAIDLQQISIELPLFERFFDLAVAIAQQQSDSPLSAIDLNKVNLADGFIVRPFRKFPLGELVYNPNIPA